MSLVGPFLWEGITFAILFLSGKIPSLKEVLHMSLKVNDNSLLATFNSLVGIVQGPEDLFSSSVLIKSQIEL